MAKKAKNQPVSIFLGGDSSFEGVIEFEGEARLDGRFSGEISGKGRLWVGPGARVTANLHATQIIISGEVEGEVIATERIELTVPGKLKGNINAPLVVMDEGVTFEGHCSMAGDNSDLLSGKVALLAAGS